MAQNTSNSMLLDTQYNNSYEDLDETMDEGKNEISGTSGSSFVSLFNTASRSSPEEQEVTMDVDSEALDILAKHDGEEPAVAKPEKADRHYRNYKIGQQLKTAYGLRDYWNTYGVIPEPKKRGPKLFADLKQEHIHFILNIVDQWAATTLDSMREQLLNAFPELKVSKTGFHRFIKSECALSMKKLEIHSERRHSLTLLEDRRRTIQGWIEDPTIDFESNCVLIDEAGFNMHLTKTRGWSIKGKPATSKGPKDRGVNISVLGAISPEGVIDISVRKPEFISCKKRDAAGKLVTEKKLIGTRSKHFRVYMDSVMDTLDSLRLTGRNLIMNNASIHKTPDTVAEIERRGYRILFLPPYSPFLNPIEEFWSKVKYGVKRHPFDKNSTLTQRILESTKAVTLSDCNGWIRHSVSFFDDCLALRPL
ncbi:hypothetical protein [Parasitella parasitica]|uniref:Tc1-like transposase DDE domain-containing protein n=1 Tax=Parasitella parasitica TaxID=35722 RepID=A0A0B7NH38_9FUNG|nr:hypothetical protein [Parasitella parasitica]